MASKAFDSWLGSESIDGWSIKEKEPLQIEEVSDTVSEDEGSLELVLSSSSHDDAAPSSRPPRKQLHDLPLIELFKPGSRVTKNWWREFGSVFLICSCCVFSPTMMQMCLIINKNYVHTISTHNTLKPSYHQWKPIDMCSKMDFCIAQFKSMNLN